MQNYFPKDLIQFCNVLKILHILKKHFSFTAWIVGKLLTPKNVVAWRAESSCFRTLFRSQSVHGRQRLLKFVWQDVYPNFPLIQDKLSKKTSLLVRSEIFELFGNTFAADHIYSRHNWGKFTQHVKCPLSQKEKTFFGIFIAFFQSTEIFAHFVKKGQLYSLSSWEVIDSEKFGCFNARKLLFQSTLRQSKCWRVPNTAEMFLAAPLS